MTIPFSRYWADFFNAVWWESDNFQCCWSFGDPFRRVSHSLEGCWFTERAMEYHRIHTYKLPIFSTTKPKKSTFGTATHAGHPTDLWFSFFYDLQAQKSANISLSTILFQLHFTYLNPRCDATDKMHELGHVVFLLTGFHKSAWKPFLKHNMQYAHLLTAQASLNVWYGYTVTPTSYYLVLLSKNLWTSRIWPPTKTAAREARVSRIFQSRHSRKAWAKGIEPQGSIHAGMPRCSMYLRYTHLCGLLLDMS